MYEGKYAFGWKLDGGWLVGSLTIRICHISFSILQGKRGKRETDQSVPEYPRSLDLPSYSILAIVHAVRFYPLISHMFQLSVTL